MFFVKNGIVFPEDLDTALTNAIWEKQPSISDLRSKAVGLKNLWEKLAKRRGIPGADEAHYSLRRQEAEAYAAYYLPSNVLKVPLILEEAFLLGFDILKSKENRWLDFGCGPGTASFGLWWWAKRREKKVVYSGLDQSPHFIDIAAKISSSQGRKNFFRAEKQTAFLSEIRRWNPSHLSFVNSVGEIYPDEKMRNLELKKIVELLEENSRKDSQPRYLLLVEPGSRESSRSLAELKDFLHGETKARVLFPCLDNRRCGALMNPKDWCHEEVACEFPSWLNELGSHVELNKQSILFSYVLFQIGGAEKDSVGKFRVVSQRLERKGQVECWLCANHGKVSARVQRSKIQGQNRSFLEVSRGDIWSEAAIGAKGDVEDFVALGPADLSMNTVFYS